MTRRGARPSHDFTTWRLHPDPHVPVAVVKRRPTNNPTPCPFCAESLVETIPHTWGCYNPDCIAKPVIFETRWPLDEDDEDEGADCG